MTGPEPWALGIDVGTSSSRAIVFVAQGQAVPQLRAHVTYSPRTSEEGASEFDGDELIEHIAACVDGALKAAGTAASKLAAVGVATFWHSMVGVDESGRPVTPLITWADTRSGAEADELKERLGAEAYHARTGAALHPSFFPARLLWLSREDPAAFSRTARWISPGEYLFLRCFGDARCSISMASATGLFDQNRCDWDDAAVAAAGISRARLSELADSERPSMGLKSEWASRWPALAKIPWTPAIGDGASSNVGSGCVTKDRVAINMGTSGAIRVVWAADDVEIPPELMCYRLDRRRFVMLGAFSDAGDDYAWLRRTLALPDDSEVERQLLVRPVDGHGLTFLPFLAGERSVGWRPGARASLHGLCLATEPLDIVQAAMEGVALRFALVASVLERQFPEAREYLASGGAIGGAPAWAHMLSDALGRPITVTTESEATCRGAALTALRAIGALADEGDAPRPTGTQLEPNTANHTRYRAALERQQTLYDRLVNH